MLNFAAPTCAKLVSGVHSLGFVGEMEVLN